MNNLYFYLSKILAPILNPTNFLIFCIIILFLIFIKNKNKLILKLLKLNVSIFLLIALLPIGNLGLKYLEKDFNNNFEYKNINNIIVLSGSDERLIASIKLAYKFKNSKIYYIGGNAYLVKSDQNYEPSHAKKLYENLNFDISRVHFVGKSRNTIENFKEIERLNLEYSETVLITSAYHMKRSMMIAKNLNLNFKPYSSDFKSISQKNLLNKFQAFDLVRNLTKFNLFFREILGIIAFKIST